jgi:RND family efflux transporter MFP subunit
MKRTMILITCLGLLALLSFGCDQSGSSADETEEKVPVTVQTVQLGDVIQTIEYNGDIKAEYEVKVFSKVPDRIEKFYVDEGDEVKKGNPIALIAATTIEQAVRQAEAGLVAARAQESNLRIEYERAQRLYRESAMSEQQYDSIKTQYEAAKAQVEQAEAALKSAKSQLDDAAVTTPITGIVGTRYYETGDMAAPSMPLVTIVQMDRVKTLFNATEEDLGKLKIKQEAVVQVKSYPEESFTGEVSKISPILDPLTRMAKIEVIINNPDHRLKPGMYARVTVTTGVIKNTMVIPRHATIENTTLENIDGDDRVIKNYYVFVADSNRAIQKKLDVVYINHEMLAVAAGIDVGDKVVIQGQNFLRDSTAIHIVNKEDSDQ